MSALCPSPRARRRAARLIFPQVACPSCGRKVAAGRFAPHLEKCMGRGRQASRNANKRLSTMEM